MCRRRRRSFLQSSSSSSFGDGPPWRVRFIPPSLCPPRRPLSLSLLCLYVCMIVPFLPSSDLEICERERPIPKLTRVRRLCIQRSSRRDRIGDATRMRAVQEAQSQTSNLHPLARGPSFPSTFFERSELLRRRRHAAQFWSPRVVGARAHRELHCIVVEDILLAFFT